MTEPEKKNKSEEFETISNTVKLQKKVFTACDDLDGHAESIGEGIFNSMLAHHYEQYLREYEKMNAQKLLDVDKEIAEFKIKREKELAEIKELQAKQTHELEELRKQHEREFELEKEKTIAEFDIRRTRELNEIHRIAAYQSNELEELRKQREREFELEKAGAEKEFEIQKTKELGEMQLEHDRVKADIERQRAKLNTELEIWKQTNEDELRAKAERVVPGYKLRRRFLGIPIGRLKPNQAWLLAMESADIETQEYLISRAQEIAERKAKAFGLNFEEQEEPAEPVFVPEAMTESELKLYLQKLEREDYL